MPTTKSTVNCRLSISYEMYDDYKRIEDLIDKAVGKKSDGSGAGFGSRDLGYYFKSLKATDAPLKRLIKLARKLEREEAISLDISVSVTY